ncbi:MAG TPA: sigma-70 family RNA polymerase sigma factor [Thermoanaerobaculia bacterium]|nr:sigma-70 family RNA polymerase sigma factor [Thermoanaerobaculia bacterium]
MSVPSVTDSSTTIPIQTWMLALQPSRSESWEGPRDEDLLARIAQGDLDSFQSFYERHASRVVAYAAKLARDRHLAEDIAQEVFTSVWTKAASFRPERGDAAGWLYTLTRNKFIDHWRRAPKAGTTEEIDDRRLAATQGEENDLQLTMRQVLARVHPDQRKAIEMAYFGGLTYQETAGELELPVGTLKSRIRIGLRNMRTLLSEPRRAN